MEITGFILIKKEEWLKNEKIGLGNKMIFLNKAHAESEKKEGEVVVECTVKLP